MSAYREDYLLREIVRLRTLVAALLERDDAKSVDPALQLALGLQEKLFPLPPSEFLALDALEQFKRLSSGLPRDAAAEKIQTYVELLVHAASLYELKDRPELALGARQLALHQALLGALELEDETADATILLLLRSLAGEHLHAPVRDLVMRFEQSRGGQR